MKSTADASTAEGRGSTSTLIDQIDARLPQTQCTKCSYPRCRDYAVAIADGEADINQCPPGGADGIRALAALLKREFKPLNPINGIERAPQIAVIDEAACIGCVKCIQACPVDAIVGASKRMHSVIASECTGCELCIPPCPVDCITMIDAPPDVLPPVENRATQYRDRFEFRLFRLVRDARERDEKLAARAVVVEDAFANLSPVQAAIARAKARKSSSS